MGLDPISIIMSIATNLATDILKNYAQRLDGTLVGRGLKGIGLIEKNRDDYLHEILEETLRLYFQTHSMYDISGVESFFREPATIQQISNYIFDHRPLDQAVIEGALTRTIKNDAITMALMQKRGGQPEQIIPEFLRCYRQVLNQHVNAAERAILLTVLDATDTVVAEIRASEERMKVFINEALQAQTLRGDVSALPPGQLIGSYRIQKHLVTGTFGSLYLAEIKSTSTLVAIKIISIPEGLRLHHDVFLLGTDLVNLKHPYILPTIDVRLDGIPSYVVTAYATGGSLSDRIRHHSPNALPLPEALTITSQVGQALAYLHQQNIVHRGIQPASILFDDASNALLTGFDLAIKTLLLRHHLQLRYTGTIDYMAPEQSSGIFSEKSDQYSLGCIAYQLCTGRLPFKESSSTSQRGQSKPPISPHLLNPKIPVQVGRAILKALSTNPNQRYDSVETFLVALSKH